MPQHLQHKTGLKSQILCPQISDLSDLTGPQIPNMGEREVITHSMKSTMLKAEKAYNTTIAMVGQQHVTSHCATSFAAPICVYDQTCSKNGDWLLSLNDVNPTCRLEDLAAAIEGSAGQQATTFDFQCMSQDVTEVLQLTYELLTQPALPQQKLDVVKAQARNALEHRDDNASSIARR